MIERDPQTLEEADEQLTGGSTEAAVEPEVAAEPAAEPGQPRDEQGRFTEAPTPEPEAPESAAPVPEIPGEPSAPAEGEAAPAEDYPSFTYRADNQEFDIPGSAVGEDGIFIPQAQVPEVQHLLSAGKAAFGSVRQRLSESASREQAANDRAAAAEAQAQHLLAHFENLIDKSQSAQTVEDLLNSPMGQWLRGVAQNWPILKAEAKAKAVELQGQTAQKQLQEYQDREQQARLKPLMDQTLRSSLWTQGQQAGLDEQTLAAVYETLQQPTYQGYLFVKAPYDDPGAGIRKGETVIDHGVVASAIRLASVNRTAPAQQQKIAAAQAENAKLTAGPTKIPPTVGGKGRAPKAGSGIPAFKSAKEADEWLLHGDLSEVEVE